MRTLGTPMIALRAACLFGCSKGGGHKSSSKMNPKIQMPDSTMLASYNGTPHVLDECCNDGLMWRASLNPSALTGTFVDLFIPLDENYEDVEEWEDAELIPNYYKWVYDRYVKAEKDLKGTIAANLLDAATQKGWELPPNSEAGPDEFLANFRLSGIYFLEPGESNAGQVELHYYLGNDSNHGIVVVVSVEPIDVTWVQDK